MKGTLSGYDTMFLLLGRGELKKGALKVQHNEEWAVLYIKDERPPRVKLTLSGRAAGKGRAGDGVQHSEIQGSGQIRRVGQRIAADGGAAYIERDGQSIQHMPRAEQRCLWVRGICVYPVFRHRELGRVMTGRANILLWRRNSELSWSWRMKM